MKLLLTSADSKGEVGSTGASAIVIIIARPCTTFGPKQDRAG